MRSLFVKLILLISFVTSIVSYSFAQSPYQITARNDVPVIGFSAATLAYATWLHKNHPMLTQEQVSAIDTTLLQLFDLPTIHYNNKRADHISTAMLFLSFSSFALPAIDPSMRKDYGTFALINAETILNGLGIYGSFKNTVNRPRPYLCSPTDSMCIRFSKGATSSFPSGHVTMTACNTFYMAKIINDNSNNLPLKISAWGVGSLYPAIVGYLRVKSGKHFPTDVIAGYFIGAATGILIASVHRRFESN